MLALLAAVVPIIGSLYAGLSFLLEQNHLRWEHRTRMRINELVESRSEGAAARADARNLRTKGAETEIGEMERLRKLLERANGLPDTDTSFRAVDLRFSLSGTAASPGEVRRQATLLLTAAVGVVLLALDIIPN